eukprot:10153207-Alexandrium_andersonii.AAC.1
MCIRDSPSLTTTTARTWRTSRMTAGRAWAGVLRGGADCRCFRCRGGAAAWRRCRAFRWPCRRGCGACPLAWRRG